MKATESITNQQGKHKASPKLHLVGVSAETELTTNSRAQTLDRRELIKMLLQNGLRRNSHIETESSILSQENMIK